MRITLDLKDIKTIISKKFNIENTDITVFSNNEVVTEMCFVEFEFYVKNKKTKEILK